MRDKFFERKAEYLTVAEIIELTNAVPASGVDPRTKIYGIATLKEAEGAQISFLHSGKYQAEFESSKAGFCLVEEKYRAKAPQKMQLLLHKNPYHAYAVVASAFYRERATEFGNPTFSVGEGTRIAPNAYIGNNVKIGKNCVIGPGVVIMDNCELGDDCVVNAGASIYYAIIQNRCIIHAGARIGQDGFGFAHSAGINHKIIQLGLVLIGNDVELGANACVDRGTIENTVIDDQVKIDNLVQIAHNVKIGWGTVIAGCSAIAGSAEIGKYVQIGGSTNIAGHIKINDYAKIAGASGVMREVRTGEAVAGAPSLPIRAWHRLNSQLMNMALEHENKLKKKA